MEFTRPQDSTWSVTVRSVLWLQSLVCGVQAQGGRVDNMQEEGKGRTGPLSLGVWRVLCDG